MVKDKQLAFLWILIIAMIGATGVFVAYRYGLPKIALTRFKTDTQTNQENKYPGNIKITSNTFSYGDEIPEKYTCKGKDINPPLSISGASSKVVTYALIIEDPDALYKVWTHWIVYNISPRTTQIYENFVPAGALLGQNDFGTDSYRGPCPPLGKHRYRFKLFALDTKLNLKMGATREDIDKAMETHILDVAELEGVFGK